MGQNAPHRGTCEGHGMIVVDKRKAARAAYWAVVALCGVSTIGPVLVRMFAARLSEGGPAAQSVTTAFDNPNTYVVVALVAGGAGYFWTRPSGYPSTDNVLRAVLLGAVLGVLFIAFSRSLGFDLDFWSGFRFGFLAGALIPPPSEKSLR